MRLTGKQIQRYSRQMVLKKIGPIGQKKLLNSKVLVVGAGGLGSPILIYLAALGIGNIGIIDHDKVDLSNLHRQILFQMDDLKKQKSKLNKMIFSNEELLKILPSGGPKLAEVQKYIDKYNEDYIVIKCGGSVLIDQILFDQLIEDISILNKQKSIVNISNEEINLRVNKSKEKEKAKVTRNLGNLTVEERQVQDIMKNLN